MKKKFVVRLFLETTQRTAIRQGCAANSFPILVTYINLTDTNLGCKFLTASSIWGTVVTQTVTQRVHVQLSTHVVTL